MRSEIRIATEAIVELGANFESWKDYFFDSTLRA